MKLEELQKEKNAVLVSTEVFCCFVIHIDPLRFLLSFQAKIMEIKRNRPGGKKGSVIIVLIRFCCCNNSVDLTSIYSLWCFCVGPDKKLRVCDVCGSFLSIFDSDK